HRIGRTGRAGTEGEALSLVCVDENKLLKDIEKLLKKDLPKQVVPNFEPDPNIKAEPIIMGRGGQSQSRSPRPGGGRSSGHSSTRTERSSPHTQPRTRTSPRGK
ncbi:MAG: hypothetical protein Q8O00_08220, partial [Holophaga sp.]|nr:hypothetical protein [Holophaga sp.]